ncbi:hypothetical protein K505DRAFT_253454, partial [Melanomma pulvis-pyrius CBS 109.77]
HALLLTLREILWEKEKRANIGLSGQLSEGLIYAQDPGYTPVDQVVLGEHGITVIGDPEGFLEVDDGTAVVSCAPAVLVKQIVTDLAQPSIMIVDRVSREDSKTLWLDPDSPRVRQYVDELYDVLPFHGEQEFFGDLAIYSRQQKVTNRLLELGASAQDLEEKT